MRLGNFKYTIEDTNIEEEHRFIGDHYPHSLEIEANAWHHTKEEAKAIVDKLGGTWRIKIVAANPPIQKTQLP